VLPPLLLLCRSGVTFQLLTDEQVWMRNNSRAGCCDSDDGRRPAGAAPAPAPPQLRIYTRTPVRGMLLALDRTSFLFPCFFQSFLYFLLFLSSDSWTASCVDLASSSCPPDDTALGSGKSASRQSCCYTADGPSSASDTSASNAYLTSHSQSLYLLSGALLAPCRCSLYSIPVSCGVLASSSCPQTV